MCDLYLTEEAKECIANLRKNHGEEVLYEQSYICQAMGTAICELTNCLQDEKEEKEELQHLLFVLYRYNNLLTLLSKEN